MKKYISNLAVIQNTAINSQTHLLKLSSNSALPTIIPGQFAELRIDGTSDVFLRRPISVNFVDYTKNELWLLVQKVGKGTQKLCELRENDNLNLLFPLGNGFTLPGDFTQKVLLIGGGVGVAPLLFLAAELAKLNCCITILIGGRSADNLLLVNDFADYGKVYFTTEDGSAGERGYVTQHSILANEKFDKIYCCGPTPMMKAVGQYACQKNIDCQISLENTMACGIGACLCCVTNTVDGHKCVCSDGPVFNINDIKWNND
ncbi:MAG: dihydroorotate dehydrogenase electron transfer subunit [Paludibacter sp.]|nr:dihydroorotate dehydrogenase electron transfer subunit [Paludibacter sp.]